MCIHRRIYLFNEDDFRFQFLISTKNSNSIDTRKHSNKEKECPKNLVKETFFNSK